MWSGQKLQGIQRVAYAKIVGHLGSMLLCSKRKQLPLPYRAVRKAWASTVYRWKCMWEDERARASTDPPSDQPSLLGPSGLQQKAFNTQDHRTIPENKML